LSGIDGLYHNGYKDQAALFAAGFLFGLVRNAGYENAGRLGALAAAEVIQHIGARPLVSLKELARKHGLPV
jgi:sugar/nucleoside kinase (ribokinase family)